MPAYLIDLLSGVEKLLAWLGVELTNLDLESQAFDLSDLETRPIPIKFGPFSLLEVLLVIIKV